MNKTCLSYWFPIIADAGLPVPRTEIVRLNQTAQEDIYRVFDGQPTTGASEPFFAELAASCDKIGYPVFLRTGLGSGKHQWKDTCCVKSSDQLWSHVFALAEWSECVDMKGLAWDVWCVREMLPTTPLLIAPMYGNMPICREFRFFVWSDFVICRHAYWPRKALRQGFARGHGQRRDLPDDFDQRYSDLRRAPVEARPIIRDLASRAGRALGGGWSIDIIETTKGWYITDLAEAEKSWHWPGCKRSREFEEQRRGTVRT